MAEDGVGTVAGTQGDQALSLVRDVARGHRAAMTRLYGLLEGPVYRFALARLNDPAAAADVLHDTLVQVWQEAGRFRAESKVLTWVLGLAAEHATLRAPAPRPAAAEQPGVALADDDGPTDMSHVLARLDDPRAVRDAVQRLSAVQRSALHLAFHEDLSYGEMAEVLGCPEGAAKARVFDAKQALKRLLAA